MNWLDAVAVLAALAAALYGWHRGLVRSSCSLIGFLAALVAIGSLVPRLLPGDDITPARFVVVVGAVWLVALAGALLGGSAGRIVSAAVVRGPLVVADRIGGVILGLLTIVIAAWLVVPNMAEIPGWAAVAARGSETAVMIDRYLGEPPATFDELGRALNVASAPRVFEDLQSPVLDDEPPPQAVDASVIESVRTSVVRLEGVACRYSVFGSGFVVAPGLVATNAHVVAGTEGLGVTTPDGAEIDGRVVHFDPERDVAIVAVPGLDRPALSLAEGEEGDAGVVIGYPRGGDLTVQPFLLAGETEARGRDIYDETVVLRRILLLATELRQGQSGGPLVDTDGAVIGMAFAVAPDRDALAYGIVVDDIIDAVDSAGRETVSSGPCA